MANLSPIEILFHEASKTGNLTTMKNVITKIINSKDPSLGCTPLHNAAEKGDPSMVKYLMENDADVNVKDVTGWTPLHHAVDKGPLLLKLT